MYDFGLLLKELRQNKGLSQAQVAQRINKSKAVVSRFESNQQMPTLETLIDLAHFYNVSLDYLVGIEKQSLLIGDLSQEQIKLLSTLLVEFRRPSHLVTPGLTSWQLQILNMLIIEFTSANK